MRTAAPASPLPDERLVLDWVLYPDGSFGLTGSSGSPARLRPEGP